MEKNIVLKELQEIKKILTEQTPKPLSLSEAATYLNLTNSALYKLTHESKITYSKPNGKKIYFQKSHLDKWSLKNTIHSEDEIEEEALKYIIKTK